MPAPIEDTQGDFAEAINQRHLGVVAIGRNEGERLKRCLASLQREGRPVVYVDSGSTDGSVEHARSVGVDVVELDMSIPFTAARARNAGFQRLMQDHGRPAFVQFVDGDCEMFDDWFEHAFAAFEQREDVAVVCGRLRERYPEATIYNRLCDMEWDTLTGEVATSGGIFMIRSDAFRQAGRFNDSIIAGEEPDLCVRLRRNGWKILRTADDMAWHDAATTRFSQWWKRSLRGGHAYMEIYTLHRNTPESFGDRNVRSQWVWGIALPLFILITAPFTYGISLLLLVLYPVLIVKIARYRMRAHGDRLKHALLYGVFTALGKLPAALGQLKYCFNRWRGRQTRIIEYKTAG